MPQLQLLDGVEEGLVRGHYTGPELGADALGKPGGTQAGDELSSILLSPLFV